MLHLLGWGQPRCRLWYIICAVIGVILCHRALAIGHFHINRMLSPTEAGCDELYFDHQHIDHFSAARPTPTNQFWSQRYFLCDKHWSRDSSLGSGPIFFYVGNEAPVDLYVTHTGLMWENAEEFGALLIFAEHRYYGKSMPFGEASLEIDPSYLSFEQALADYAVLIAHLKVSLEALDSPVIAFGGSYGGMLASWLRQKYPLSVAGAIAGSAPVGSFVSKYNIHPFDPASFWEAVTYDASPAAGSSENCIPNTRRTFDILFRLATSNNGLEQLSRVFRTCQPLTGEEDALDLAYWIQGAFDSFAMGNYPYPSSYIGGSESNPLPAWPMRVACSFLNTSDPGDGDLLQAMKAAVDVLYNATRDAPCYNVTQLSGPAGPGDAWIYQWCTERGAQELPFFPANGKTDMFWDQGPFDEEKIAADCLKAFNVTPRVDWAVIAYGGFDVSQTTNVVFSNGGYDPWRVGGILSDASDSVVSVFIPEGAHHLDLMFSHPDDPASVTAARIIEKTHMWRWVDQHRRKLGHPVLPNSPSFALQ